MRINRRPHLCLLAVISCVLPAVLPAFAQQPDLILTNGHIITVDDRFRIAQAVAIKGERIVAVGNSRDIARLAGPDTRRLGLHSRAIAGMTTPRGRNPRGVVYCGHSGPSISRSADSCR
jgi:hypothetical protein